MTTSSINTTIPVANSLLSSAPVRSNFQAAANDINALFTLTNATALLNIAALRTGNTGNPQIYVQGYKTAGDGGGGFFWLNSADTTSADNGFTVILDVNNNRYYRMYVGGVYNILQAGADPTGVLASDTAFATAITVLEALGYPVELNFPPGTYTLNNQYALRVDQIRLTGAGAVLNFAGMSTSGIAITYSGPGTGNPYYYDQVKILDGARFVGPGIGTTSTALYFNTSAEGGTSHLQFSGLHISQFGGGISVGNNAYLLDFSNCFILYNGIGLNVISGGTNYGENITLTNCCLAANAVGISNNTPYGMVTMLGGALDYNTTNQIVITNGGIVNIFGANIEATQFSGGYDFTVSGSGGHLVVYGGSLSHSVVVPDANLAVINVGSGATAAFRDVFCNNLLNTAKVFAAGAGQVFFDGRQTYSTDTGNPYYLGSSSNFSLLSDPGFEAAGAAGTKPFDDIEILADTATITNPLTGSNCALAVSSTQAHSGTYSLKFTKTTANAAGEFGIIVPIQESRRYSFTGYYYVNSGSSGGPLYVSVFYAKLTYGTGGCANILNQTSPGGQTLTIPTTLVGWTTIGDVSPDSPPPTWATHAIIQFNAYSVGTLAMYIDDLVFTAY